MSVDAPTPNVARLLVGSELLEQIASALGARRSRSGVMLVHLRRMRQVSALLGTSAALALLHATQARLIELLRPIDRVFLIAPNELMVVLPGLLSRQHGMLAARKVLREFESSIQVLERPMTPVLTLALAVADDVSENVEVLVGRAQGALDQALEMNRRLVIAPDLVSESWLLDDLRDALVNNELSVQFQPVYALREHRIVAVEALARWNSARHGVIPPGRFISLAEQTGLAPELTRWGVNAVLREYAPLRQCDPALRCAFNLSPKVIGQFGLEEQIHSALAIWDIPASSLILEVTESAVMEDPELSTVVLTNLRESGVHISIDDFGQGYSSFTYLKNFPASELKIDQSFVTSMDLDPRSRQLVKAIIDFAHDLGMQVVAEGVENQEVLQHLIELKCDMAQGYHLARPLAKDDMLKLLQA